jgi:hypothetical protein
LAWRESRPAIRAIHGTSIGDIEDIEDICNQCRLHP